MALYPSYGTHRRLLLRLSLGVAVACLAAGCAKTDKRGWLKQTAAVGNYEKRSVADAGKTNPLHAATAYWGAAYEQNPKDAQAAHNYAVNLKAIGSDKKAYDVLAAAYRANPGDARIASEYGRLALQYGDIPLATRLLTQAETTSRVPDYRLLSALGTLKAKAGEHDEAQRYYVRALQQKPDSLATMNNLALSYALEGKAAEAEKLLRRVVAQGGESERVRQNLALVLGLQGKFDEGQQLAQADLPAAQADANMTYLRNMIRKPQVALAEAEPEAIEPTPAAPIPSRVASAGREARKAESTKAPVEKQVASAPSPKAAPLALRPAVGPAATFSTNAPTTADAAPTFGAWPDRLPWLTASTSTPEKHKTAAVTPPKRKPAQPKPEPAASVTSEQLPWLTLPGQDIGFSNDWNNPDLQEQPAVLQPISAQAPRPS